MTVTEVIAPHLPYLRRFARALCGGQESGDAHVVAMLEAMVADPTALDRALEPKVAIYKLFLRLWDSVPTNAGAAPAGEDADKLSRLTPRSRQAFLLMAVEGFSADDAALVLGIDGAALAALRDKAAREIAEQVETEVLIIEDEAIIAMDLEALVESLGHNVIDVARTHKQALEIVGKRRPGLILADIQLADGSSGLDAVNDILQKFDVPIVFITAYPERLLTGAKPEPTFLITKPFQTDTLKAVISQALFFDQKARRRQKVA
jgi:CheY-like chemotaxis protein